jgi:hypothetical protein
MKMNFEAKEYKGQHWRSNIRYTQRILLGASFSYCQKEWFRAGDIKKKLREENNPFQATYLQVCVWMKKGSGVSLDMFDRTELGLKRMIKYGIIETKKEGDKRFYRVTDRGHKLLADWYWQADHLVDRDEGVRLVSNTLREVS